jgi:hypothetical protein
MSDLQCPATVLLVPLASCASGACARSFDGRRLSGYFVDASIAANPDELAAIRRLAEASNCPVEIVGALNDGTSLAQTLEQLSDLYRGETIALVTTAGVIRSLLGYAHLPTEPITVAIDSSGWVVTDNSSYRQA